MSATDPAGPIEAAGSGEHPDAAAADEALGAAAPGDVVGRDHGGGARPPLPPLRAMAGWLAFTVLLGVLDGWVGASAGVLIAAVVLAGIDRRAIAAAGAIALMAVPVAVLVDGVPSPSQVSPDFVSRSLWPHHLSLVGFALVGAWVVLDTGRRFRAGRDGGSDPAPPTTIGKPLGSAPSWIRWVLFGIVAVGATAACGVVLTR